MVDRMLIDLPHLQAHTHTHTARANVTCITHNGLKTAIERRIQPDNSALADEIPSSFDESVWVCCVCHSSDEDETHNRLLERVLNDIQEHADGKRQGAHAQMKVPEGCVLLGPF